MQRQVPAPADLAIAKEEGVAPDAVEKAKAHMMGSQSLNIYAAGSKTTCRTPVTAPYRDPEPVLDLPM